MFFLVFVITRKCCSLELLSIAATNDVIHIVSLYLFIGPIPWGHSGPLCHMLSLSMSSWTSMHRRRATVPLATSAEWA